MLVIGKGEVHTHASLGMDGEVICGAHLSVEAQVRYHDNQDAAKIQEDLRAVVMRKLYGDIIEELRTIALMCDDAPQYRLRKLIEKLEA